MSLRSAAQICQRVTNAIAFIMYNIGICILNYLAGDETRQNASFKMFWSSLKGLWFYRVS
jgi:hypothetical protein